jgi:uncharacterized RDD family membrane protein YckC
MSEENTYNENPFAPPLAAVNEPLVPADEQVPADRLTRFLAILIDGLPFLAIGVVGAIAISVVGAVDISGSSISGRGDGATAFGIFALVVGMASIAWAAIMINLSYRYGQTIGKRAMGIRVVRLDGSRISFARIFFMRNFVPALVGAIPLVGSLFGLLDPLWIFGGERRCLHDLIADSKVVTAASSPDATLEGHRRSLMR